MRQFSKLPRGKESEMKWKVIPILMGILVIFFCGSILAQMQPPPRGGRDTTPRTEQDPRMEQAIDMMFQDMDANLDGRISKREWMAAQEKQFRRLDRNGDGFISKDEVRADMMDRVREMQQERPGGRDRQ